MDLLGAENLNREVILERMERVERQDVSSGTVSGAKCQGFAIRHFHLNVSTIICFPGNLELSA